MDYGFRIAIESGFLLKKPPVVLRRIVPFFLTLSILGTSPLFALGVQKVFDSDHCRREILNIHEKRGQEYEKRADAQGLTGEERKEFINRSLRRRYLVDEWDWRTREFAFWQDLTEVLIENNFFVEVPVRQRSRSARSLARQLLQVDLGDDKTLDTEMPRAMGLLLVKPPKNLQGVHMSTDILEAVASAANYREEVSNGILKELPLNRRADQFSRKELDGLQYRATMRMAEQEGQNPELVFSLLMDPDLISALARTGSPRLRKPPTDYPALLKLLLTSNEIPRALKGEIEIQLDFEKKYGYAHHPTLKFMADKMAEYFEIPVPLKP